jgi:hypothetical protein
MAFKNAKEGTGVRARGDLSPNPRKPRPSTALVMDDDRLEQVAWYLIGEADKARDTVSLPKITARAVADAMLACIGRGRK